MATMNSAQFRDVVEPLLNDVFDGIYEELENEWKPVFKQENALARRWQEDPVLAGFNVAQEKDEGVSVTYDEGGEAYKVRFIHKVYALAFSLTEELMEDGDHISMGTLYSEHLARSMAEASEIVHVNIFNRATTAAYTGGDGKTLLATDHPLFGGGTFSNMLSTPANLSEASLEQLLIQIRNAVDERNKRISLRGRRLIVSPSDMFNAERILKSALRSGTGNNDTNAMKSMGMLPDGIHVLSRLSNTKFYGIQTNAPRGFIHKKRAALKRTMEGDFPTGSMRYKSRERYSATWVDPRCFYGSQGV